MHAVEFEPTISVDERPQTYALNRGPLGPAIIKGSLAVNSKTARYPT
jgi:hypothetical protein